MNIPVMVSTEDLKKEICDELADKVTFNVANCTYMALKDDVDKKVWSSAVNKLGVKDSKKHDADRWFAFYKYCVKETTLKFLNENKNEIIEVASKSLADRMCNNKENKSEVVCKLLGILYE